MNKMVDFGGKIQEDIYESISSCIKVTLKEKVVF